MDLRHYDTAIGRWTVMDPVVHHDFSPSSAFDNNPAYWADPSGANSIQYDWGSGMYNVLGNNGDVLGIIEPGDFNLSQYLNNPDSYITSVLYSMDTSFDGTGNGGGSGGLGNGNGGGNGGGDPIKKYVSSLDGTKINYLLAENVGIAGSFQIKGGLVVDVYGEITKLTVGVTGRTLAKNVGEINWGATIEIFSGEKLISRHIIQRRNESYLVTTGYDYIGYLQTNFNNISDLNIRVNINYIFNNYGQRAASSTYTKHFYYD